MLVLSRQRDETIMIGDDIEITVVDVRGEKVRLGITAPAHVPVHRKEIYDAMKRESRASGGPGGGPGTGRVESLAKKRDREHPKGQTGKSGPGSPQTS